MLSQNATPQAPTIKVLMPQLPGAAKLLPYLERIDASRTYSNYGPLSREFTRRLGESVGGSGVALTSNGTTAIEIALRLQARPSATLCLMPAFTFIASAHAVCNAGLTPYLLNVDPETLTLTPEIAAAALQTVESKVAAVLVVSAFGAPPDLASWADFEAKHGIPVVFDAAAAVTSLSGVGTQPACVSLHATKVLGIGEGGAIFSSDPRFVEKATALTGFGFMGPERVSSIRAGNYRISEYTAAVGLAVMDGLQQHIQVLRELTAEYERRLQGKAVHLQKGVGHEWVTMTLNMIVPPEEVDATTRRLDAARVEWRRWWGFGCHRHPAFADVPRVDLAVTDALAPRVIGLPFHNGLSRADLDRIAKCMP
ncbi:MAG: DegT/DnrJ/EryC1/StrS family aminotransferase [Variovorax sp.]